MSVVNTKCEIHAEATVQGRKIIGNFVVWQRNKSFFPVILCTISTVLRVHGCLDQDNSELQDLGDNQSDGINGLQQEQVHNHLIYATLDSKQIFSRLFVAKVAISCRKSGDHFYEDLAKSGYKPRINYKITNHPSICLATQ
jgi:hypothetical protein